jgi:low temperature requirement protein LtrA
VFAITQVTSFLSDSPTWGGLLRGLLLLGVLWWAWSAYAWLTNTLDPEEGAARLGVLDAVAAMLVVSLAAPGAFGRDGVTFGVAFLVVRALHLVLFAVAGRGDRDLFRAVMRIVPGAVLGATLLSSPASSTVRRNSRAGAPRWRSATSVPSWVTCADGACRRRTSSSVSG